MPYQRIIFITLWQYARYILQDWNTVLLSKSCYILTKNTYFTLTYYIKQMLALVDFEKMNWTFVFVNIYTVLIRDKYKQRKCIMFEKGLWKKQSLILNPFSIHSQGVKIKFPQISFIVQQITTKTSWFKTNKCILSKFWRSKSLKKGILRLHNFWMFLGRTSFLAHSVSKGCLLTVPIPPLQHLQQPLALLVSFLLLTFLPPSHKDTDYIGSIQIN